LYIEKNYVTAITVTMVTINILMKKAGICRLFKMLKILFKDESYFN